MKIYPIKPTEVDADLYRRWCLILNNHPLYRSPYYHPEYTLAVAAVRSDVRLLVMEDVGRICGFFPFHQTAKGALTVGEILTDYQGPVADMNLQLPVKTLLKAMRTSYFGFNHMPSERLEFSRHAWQHSRSLQLNLDGGFAAYSQRLMQQRDASLLKKVDTNRRKLRNKFGELRFEMQSISQTDFDGLLAGKSEQFRRTGGTQHDLFAVPWIRAMVQRLFQTRQPAFSGIFSVLFVGERMIAAHFGLRSEQVLHYWFPWYDTEYAGYSPGLILLASCAEGAAEQGLRIIDLGRGEQAYKQRFTTGYQALCEGAVSSPMLVASAHGYYHQGRQAIKSSQLGHRIRAWKQAQSQPLNRCFYHSS